MHFTANIVTFYVRSYNYFTIFKNAKLLLKLPWPFYISLLKMWIETFSIGYIAIPIVFFMIKQGC